jgi:hypothetical protein
VVSPSLQCFLHHPLFSWLCNPMSTVDFNHHCCTSVIITLWPTHISIHDVTTKFPKPADPRRLSICNLLSRNTSHSHDNLRRVSKSPLLHLFTCHRSGTLDWCDTKATSADSSRLIHTSYFSSLHQGARNSRML